MKSDLTCPIEVVRASVETREAEGEEQILCQIDFLNLTERTVDSLQMNIICFDGDGARIGGRLVRAAAHGGPKERFAGTFMPEHVNGAARVEASVEKVWYEGGMMWRREERNVREYEPNALAPGRDLDRLRAAAGSDAMGYAREDDSVWMCVCSRANLTSEETCMRCGRSRADVMKHFSRLAIEETIGKREAALEAKSMEAVMRSVAETIRIKQEEKEREARRRRRIRVIIGLLIFIACALAFVRWLLPVGIMEYGRYRMNSGLAADAKAAYSIVNTYWPGTMQAQARMDEAEAAIIRGMIENGSEAMLGQAMERARLLGGEAGDSLYADAVIARAEQLKKAGDLLSAEAVLRNIADTRDGAERLNALIYEIAQAAAERVDYDTAIARYASLGDYQDAAEKRAECIYDYGRQLMREGHYAEAAEQFLLVPEREDVVSLVRSCRYNEALQKQAAGDMIGAAELYETLGVYEEADTRAKACRYAAGMAAIGTGDLEGGAEQLRLAGRYEDAQEQLMRAALSIGEEAAEAEDWEKAVLWLMQAEQKPAQELLRKSVYERAAQWEAQGRREEAAIEFASLADYEDAKGRADALLYAIATEEMENSPDSARERFELLGNYQDARTLARRCAYLAAAEKFDKSEYQAAMEAFLALGKYEDSAAQAMRSRYALAGQKADAKEFDEAAALYEACGSYLDAPERALACRYDAADALAAKGENATAAEAFAALGSYEDAKQRQKDCEDAWLGGDYKAATLDMQVGDYESAVRALEAHQQEKLPERYASMKTMYVEACVKRAQELLDARRPFDALPMLRRVPENAEAKKMLARYVYQVIGRWKDRSGVEYNFREDGSCAIAGEEAYFSGMDYDIFVGGEPNPTKAVYEFVSLKNGTLTLKKLGTNITMRLTYLGEPKEKPEKAEKPSEMPEAESAEEPAQTPGPTEAPEQAAQE